MWLEWMIKSTIRTTLSFVCYCTWWKKPVFIWSCCIAVKTPFLQGKVVFLKFLLIFPWILVCETLGVFFWQNWKDCLDFEGISRLFGWLFGFIFLKAVMALNYCSLFCYFSVFSLCIFSFVLLKIADKAIRFFRPSSKNLPFFFRSQ